MIVKMCMINSLGRFEGEEMEVTEEQYKNLVEISKKFYTDDNGFEMWLKDGFLIAAPEIVKQSILTLDIIEYDGDNK